MRGSPLFRTVLVLLALLAAAFGIRSIAVGPVAPPPAPPAPAPETVSSAPFFLTFSSPPAVVILESAGEILELKPEGVTTSGRLSLSGDHPSVFVTVRWSGDDASAPRFTKLTLEPAGQSTQTRTFDGFGEIEDVWELHLHH